MTKLPPWMRRALFATAMMNLVVSAAFAPPAHAFRTMVGMPNDAHPLYLATVGLFVLLFGLGYLWLALTGRPDRLFIALAAAGKIGFFSLLVWFAATGRLALHLAAAGSADLVFGALFVAWLATPVAR
ncbi:MAG TPA: hypothetical protein VKA21_05835 [Candidatus Binatia bacterium]|nr:hypothetical protein [Candidatus Binatia bacterium]